MKKVFLIHGFEGSPNGGWRPWLMAELEKIGVYACALPMPNSENPVCSEWIEEISHALQNTGSDEIYLIGHSLGVPAILRYLENTPSGVSIAGVILVSGPSEKNDNEKLNSFFDTPFDFETIKSRATNFVFIHGDNDPAVPLGNAEFLSDQLQGELIVVPNGGHLNGGSGWLALPQALDALKKLFK